MAKLIGRGFLLTSEPTFTTKFVSTNFVVNAVGVWGARNPLTKSLAHLPRLFAVKEILIARLFIFPLLTQGVWGECGALLPSLLGFLSKRIEESNIAHKTRSFAHAVSFFTPPISETLVRTL
jgi:hypothetical protein